MKQIKKSLALILVLVMILSLSPFAMAAGTNALDNLPAGTYTYVDAAPAAAAGSDKGELQFVWAEKKLVWAYGSAGSASMGSAVLAGDELEFFQSLYLSDVPAYDWLASAMRDTDGYAGNLAGNLLITISENGKISTLKLDSGLVQMTVAVTKNITDSMLTVSGATRGQPNLLHSCVTLVGSTNGLFLTAQGNVVLDNLSIGKDENGVGLKADKIGGDTFVAGTVVVDGKIEWNCRYANIQPVHADEPATLMTNGQDITMGGMNIGRTGRNLTISTGEKTGGDITIGAVVSVDYGRGAPLKDPSTGTLLLSTTGNIIAGLGNVVIGTNTERKVNIDTIGNIQGANVTINPTYNGTVAGIQGSIGNITASGDVTIVAGDVAGELGNITAKGTASLKIKSIKGIGTISAATIEKDIGTAAEEEQVAAVPTASSVSVNGKTVAFAAYNINGSNYFKLRDLAYALSGTEKQFNVYWQDGVANTTITLTSGKEYTPVGGEMAAKGSESKNAKLSAWTIYLDGKMVSLTAYNIDGNNYFKLRDIGKAFDFGVSWDSAANKISIETGKGYTA